MTCDGCQREKPCAMQDSGEFLCEDCVQNQAEAAYERSLSECFRGGEYAAHLAEQQAQARRLK